MVVKTHRLHHSSLKEKKSLLTLLLESESRVAVLRIRICRPNPQYHTARKWHAGHLFLCSPVDNEEKVTIGNKSIILGFQLVVVFPIGKALAELDL